MPGDARRQDPGFEIRYMIDQSAGETASDLSNAETEAAIERSFATWESDRCTLKVDLVNRSYPGGDITIFDGYFNGKFGNPTLSDIVMAGWLPPSFFDTVFGPGGGEDILAFSITFTWVDADRKPTDLNGDNYLDTARDEIYFNDGFGAQDSDREEFPWSIDQAWPAMDVESISLHELGHGLGLGHFGPPPIAVMNPAFRGLRQSLLPADHSGACILFASGGRESK